MSNGGSVTIVSAARQAHGSTLVAFGVEDKTDNVQHRRSNDMWVYACVCNHHYCMYVYACQLWGDALRRFLANNQPLRGNGERIRPARASARYNYVILWRASYAPAPLLYDIIVARARILLLLC
jgi:hypothetical protein